MQSKDGNVSKAVDMVEEGMSVDILDSCNDTALKQQRSTELRLLVNC